MEPLTVLSLVSNIIQLVQTAADAATKCHEIYNLGAPIEDLQLAYTSDQLHQCYTTLGNFLQSNQAHKPLPCGIDLRSLSAECCQSAKTLHEEMKALQKCAGEGRRKALAKFLLRKRKAKDIQVLRSRLEEYQQTLDTRLLADIEQIVTELSSRQQTRDLNFDQKLSEIAADLSSCHGSLVDNLRQALEKSVEANKHEHEITRADIRSHFDNTVHGQAQRQELAKRRDQFLESLRYDDINVRGNEISQSHSETFGWVFDEKAKHPWDSLSDWFQHGQDVYWINGKAGSGKSTFMKFLINDQRTSQALRIWSGGKDCMILEFYFWLSGSKFQRSMKGFLCSLLLQIANLVETVLEDIFQTNDTVLRKRSIGDWSLGELRKMLDLAIKSVNCTGNICIFLDGLDEFDQDEDVQNLLDFIEEVVEFPKTKFCVSSRPEIYFERRLSQYDKLRLQDLTAEDMKICITDALDRTHKMHPSISIAAEDIQKFTRLMTEKADGVFLWVHFALKSVLKGMSNEEDFGALLTRLEELPRGMEQLYQQMWLRLNGDERRYREEASLYFSYHNHFPLSLFEMMVALHSDIQARYFQDMRSLDPTEMAKRCKLLKIRILSRCAGLLEVATVNEKSEQDDFLSAAGSSDVFRSKASQPGNEEEASFNIDSLQVAEEEAEEELCNVIGNTSPALEPLASETSSNSQDMITMELQQYYHTKINFLHRTARDFLFDTETGRAIAGETSQTPDELFSSIMKAHMTNLLQGLVEFDGQCVRNPMRKIVRYDTKFEIDLLKTLRQVCEALNVPGSSTQDINQGLFWIARSDVPCDFVGCAAYEGCIKYVQFFLDHTTDYISPYYRGYLFSCAVRRMREVAVSEKLQLANWLAQNGADLNTKHLDRYCHVYVPFELLLLEVLRSQFFYFGSEATKMAQLIETLYPTTVRPTDKYASHVRLPDEMNKSLGLVYTVIEVGALCLCRLALYHLARCEAIIGSISLIPLRSNTPLRVVLLEKTYHHAHRPTYEDSIYLGEAYEKVLFLEDYADAPTRSLQNFISRTEEVLPRCDEVEVSQWKYQMELEIEEHRDGLVLDPSEDVDESNWKERGWFRTASTRKDKGRN